MLVGRLGPLRAALWRAAATGRVHLGFRCPGRGPSIQGKALREPMGGTKLKGMMLLRPRPWLTIVMALLCAGTAIGQAVLTGATGSVHLSYPRSAAEWGAFLAPDPRFAEIGAIKEPMPTLKLAEAGLIASGVPAGRMDYYIDRLRQTFEALRGRSEYIQDPSLRAESILPYLHKTLFKEYREDATTVDGVIDTGFFNCVSSAVIYLLAARVFVLPMKGVQTTDHAFCVLTVAGRDIDVETTNPFGYDPGTSKEFFSSFTKTTKFAYVPPQDYANRKTITEKDLVGLILHNRGVEMLRRGRPLEALRLALDRATGFPGQDATDFLATCTSHVLVELFRADDWAGALELTRAVQAFDPSHPEMIKLGELARENYSVDAHNRFAAQYNSRRIREARAILEEALRILPGDRRLTEDLEALR